MPIIHVHHPEEALPAETKAALARRLTDVLIEMEGGANTDGGRGFAWVLFTSVKQGDWWIGGKLDDTFVKPPGRFLVHVTIPEGYMNRTHKNEVHAAVNTAILEATGSANAPGGGATILVVIDEVPEGNWGAAGKTISLASIADTVGLPKGGERFGWVQAYFDAKARQFAEAGYPPDTGGLLPRR
jgi:phenylpyruvate tautomerase PptA (4-oxalocrotonate tautomerase family)